MFKVDTRTSSLTHALLSESSMATDSGSDEDMFVRAPGGNISARNPLSTLTSIHDEQIAARQASQSIEKLSGRGRLMWTASTIKQLQQIPSQLAEMAQRAGLHFVCLDHPDRLEELLVALRPSEQGWKVTEGPLQQLFDAGGWLYIHYEQFSAAEAESLNDLFASTPTFRGRLLHPNVVIFGAMLRATLGQENQSEAFVSRFDAWVEARTLAPDTCDPIDQITRVDPHTLESVSSAVVDLFGDHDFASRLFARACVQEGQAQLVPGALRAALAQHDRVVLRDAPWNDLGFCMFVRALHKGAASDLEGPLRLRPGQSIVRCDGPTAAEQAAARMEFASTPAGVSDAHPITARNFGFLTRTMAIQHGHVRDAPGVLSQLATEAPLRVVSKLLPHQWRELAYGGFGRHVYVDAGVSMPTWMLGYVQHRPAIAAPAQPCDLNTLTQLPNGASCVVQCEDIDMACHLLTEACDKSEVFDVGSTTEAGDLLYAIRRSAHQFHITAQHMWNALQHGKTVILRRLSTNPNLAVDLLPLLANPKPVLWCETAQVPMRGRLFVLEDDDTRSKQARLYKLRTSARTLTQALQKSFPWVDAAWVQTGLDFLADVGALRQRRQLMAGPAPSHWALLRRAAALQQGQQLLTIYDAQTHQQALTMAFAGAVAFDVHGSATMDAWLQARFGAARPQDALLRQPRTKAMWEAKLDACAELLRRWPAIFLQGPSGAGKTYCTQALAKRLDATVHGPLSVGDDTSADDVLGQLHVQDGATVWQPACVDQWARARGAGMQLLVVDEANLVPGNFWNFFNGMFDAKPALMIDGQRVPLSPQHRIIFTGNQDDYPGRVVSQFIKSHFVTVPFHTFDDTFLVDEILSPTLTKLLPKLPLEDVQSVRKVSCAMIAALREAKETQLLTPRNIEEATLRMVLHLRGTSQDNLPGLMANALLDVQPGHMSPSQAAAMRAWTTLHFGAAPHLAPKSWVDAAIDSHRRMVPTESSVALAQTIADFLAVRIARQGGGYRGIGQTGMLIEGPSGRGKDEWVMSICEAAGLKRLSTEQETPGDGYMCLNAGLGFTHLKEMITWAQRRGQVVVISELNLLGSALVEGQLNGLLQGDAAPGFSLIATVNPGYQGRYAMSEAQRNRCICVTLAPYREPELLQLAASRLSADDAHLAPQLVAYHLAVISMLDAAERATRPTPRELLRVCGALPDTDVQSVLRRVYEPYLLMANATHVDVALQSCEDSSYLLSLAQSVQTTLGLNRAAWVQPNAEVDGFGTQHLVSRVIHVSAQSTLPEQAAQVVLQSVAAAAHPEARHAVGAAIGVSWEAVNVAVGYCLTIRLLREDTHSHANILGMLPEPPDGPSAWERACDATTRQEHFAYGLACELMYPGTHAAMPTDSLTAVQRASCLEVQRAAAALSGCINTVAPLSQGHERVPIDAVRAQMLPILTRYAELAPLTAWQAIRSVMPTEAMGVVWRAGKAGIGATLDATGRGAVAVGRFASKYRKPLLIGTAPLWLGPVAVTAIGVGVLVGGCAIVVGGVGGVLVGAFAGVEWTVDTVGSRLFHWRTNRNLSHPAKAFRYHSSLDKLRDVDFVRRPHPLRITGTGTGYLAEGYLSEFTRHGNLRAGRYDDAPLPAPDMQAPSLKDIEQRLDAIVDLQKKQGQYQVSLPTEGNLCPTNVTLWVEEGHQLTGDARVARTEDGRFVATLSHSRQTLFGPRSRVASRVKHEFASSQAEAPNTNQQGKPLMLRYELRPQAPAPTPQSYGRTALPFRIDYKAWPECDAVCNTLSPNAPEHSVEALCAWLRENALYDRGYGLALQYGWSEIDLTFKHNSVNTFLRLRRGSSLQSAQVLMALVRDRLHLPVRVATGVYAAAPRTPRKCIDTMHAWCEVHLPKQGWVTFDPTPRRWADDWVRRRSHFYDALSETLGCYTPPPHIPVLERLGDTFEQPTILHEAAPTSRLRVTYQVAGDEAITGDFSEVLAHKYFDSLFASGLRPQQRLAVAPPGALDIARLARGEARVFVNTDVGRTPLRKTMLVAACEIMLPSTLEGVEDVRYSRIFWGAFFRLGCPVEVLQADGTIVSVADIDEMLALAHALGRHGQVREIEPALRRHDAMVAQAVARRRASHMYVRLDISELSELLGQTAQETVLQVERPTAVTGTITEFSAKHRASWAAFTHVTFHNIALTHRIYGALKHMPRVQSITVTGALSMGAVHIPYLPQLRDVRGSGLQPMWFNFDFVPGALPWPLHVNRKVYHLGTDTSEHPPCFAQHIHPSGLGDDRAKGSHLPAAQQIYCQGVALEPELEPNPVSHPFERLPS